MTPEQNLDLLRRVLRVLRDLDERDACHFSVEPDGSISPYTLVNDVFYWACSDAEAITPENVAEYERAAADFQRLIPRTLENVSAACNGSWDVGVLFTCRVRKMRPFKHKDRYPTDERLWPLIDELPERKVDSDGCKLTEAKP